jgi:predicted nuclease of predicted toxin-antitoxin system
MKFLFDANMPRAAQRVALARGHAVEYARDIGFGDASDAHIAEHARTTGAILVTRDTDFADIRNISPNDFPGIPVLRLPHNTTAAQIANILDRILGAEELVMKMPGHLAIADSWRVRFRSI